MKAATAYERGKQVFLHASSKTTAGVWVLSSPVAAASLDAPDEIRQMALAALDGSVENAPHPKSWTNLFDPVLTLAGVKSMNTFVKSARCVEMELDGGVLTLIPTRNDGVDEGFVPLTEKARSVPEGSKELGNALIAALEDAE